MPWIEYRGHTPEVSVPTHNLAAVERGVPVEVPQHVADDLTLAGASPTWVLVDASARPALDDDELED